MTDTRTISEKFADADLTQRAMQAAFRAAVIRHRQAGVPMSFEEDGKIVIIDANQIPIDHIPEL